jgi:hypothetical protein
MFMEYYRFIVNGEGIYQMFSKEKYLNDPARINKPDGSWLPKVGENILALNPSGLSMG